jgi:hypothetical protein
MVTIAPSKSYVQTNKALLDILAQGLVRERKLIRELNKDEKRLKRQVLTESRKIQNEKVAETKTELLFKIKSYKSQLESIKSDLTKSKRTINHSLATIASLRKEITSKHSRAKQAEKTLQINLAQLLSAEKAHVESKEREKSRHDGHMAKLRQEKELLSKSISAKVGLVEKSLRTDKHQQQGRVNSVERTITGLLKQKKDLRKKVAGGRKSSNIQIHSLVQQKSFILRHLSLVKSRLSTGKKVEDPLFDNLLKRWFSTVGRLADKEKQMFAQAEAGENVIKSKLETVVKDLVGLREKWSQVEQEVQKKAKDVANQENLIRRQKKLEAALQEQKTSLKLLKKNLLLARKKRQELDITLAAEELELQRKRELKEKKIKQAKKSFEQTLSVFEHPGYKLSKTSVGRELKKVSSLNHELITLQQEHDASLAASSKVADKIDDLTSSVGHMQKNIDNFTANIVKNNKLLRQHRRVSEFLQKEQKTLQDIVGKMGVTQSLKNSFLRKRTVLHRELNKEREELDKSRSSQLQNMLEKIQRQGETRLAELRSHINKERAIKKAFDRGAETKKKILTNLISKKEILLDARKKDAIAEINKLRQGKLDVIRNQGQVKLEEIQKKMAHEEQLKRQADKDISAVERQVSKRVMDKRKEYAREKSLLNKKSSELRTKKSSTNAVIIAEQKNIQRMLSAQRSLELRTARALSKRKDLISTLEKRSEDLKKLNRIVAEKIQRIKERRTLAVELKEVHSIVNQKLQKPKVIRRYKTIKRFKDIKRVHEIKRFKTMPKYKTITKVKTVPRYKIVKRYKTIKKYKTITRRISKHIKEKGPKVKDAAQMKVFLKGVDKLLGKLPPEEIKKFSKSKEFKMYKTTLNKYGVK